MRLLSAFSASILGIGLLSGFHGLQAAEPPPTPGQRGSWVLAYSGRDPDARYASLSFPDATHGWMVGSSGRIRHTRDAGLTWDLQASPFTNRLTCVQFVTAKIGWAVGEGRTVLSTVDGGKSWKADLLPEYGPTRPTCVAMHFVNAQEGWIAHNYGGLFHTLDSGRTWTAQEHLAPGALISMCFVDAKTGWVLGVDHTLLKTTNGGRSWESQFVTVPTTNIAMVTTVFFVNATHGWVGNTTTISSRSDETSPLLRTTDGGKTWSAAGRWPGNWVRDIQFQDADTGYCVDMGGIFSTRDGGRSWLRELDSNAGALCQMVSVGQARRWVLTSTGDVYTHSP